MNKKRENNLLLLVTEIKDEISKYLRKKFFQNGIRLSTEKYTIGVNFSQPFHIMKDFLVIVSVNFEMFQQ